MIPIGIVDSSCIIALNRIERLDLLSGHFHQLIIPEVVAEEVGKIPGWIKVQAVSQPRILAVFPSGVHKGEAEVILLGLENPGSVVVLDDCYAREFATKCGLSVVGTIGLIMRARRERRIDAATPIFLDLISAGFRLSEEVLAEAKRLLGE